MSDIIVPSSYEPPEPEFIEKFELWERIGITPIYYWQYEDFIDLSTVMNRDRFANDQKIDRINWSQEGF